MEGFFLRTILFANGPIQNIESTWQRVQPSECIIAADGGWQHCQLLNLKPDLLIGDFDSITPAELQSIQAQGIRTIRYPDRKDETDLELALHFAVQNGGTQIIILGGLGARWDQTLANILLLTQAKFRDLPISLVDGNQEMFILNSASRSNIPIDGYPGDTVSLIPLLGDVQGISTYGLDYPLENETLPIGSTRGISNVILQSPAAVTIQNGILMIVVIHKPLSLNLGDKNEKN